MKKIGTSLLVLSLLLVGIAAALPNNNVLPLFEEQSTNANAHAVFQASSTVTNGSISGTNITYSYGTRTFSESGNYTAIDHGFKQETIREEKIKNVTVDLINPNNVSLKNIIFKVEKFRYWNDGTNDTKVDWYDNTTLNETLDFILALPGLINYSFEESSPVEVYLLSTEGEYLGSTFWNSTIFEFNATFMNATWIIEPQVLIFSIEKVKNVQVTLNWTTITVAALAYYSVYNVNYSVNVEEWYAQIRDGNRHFLHVSAFKRGQLNFTQFGFFKLDYFMFVANLVNLTYAENDSYVPDAMYPVVLKPSAFSMRGQMSLLDIAQSNLTTIGTTNTILQAFHARLSENFNQTEVNASSLVAWLIQTTPRLIAYQDANFDNQLNLAFSTENGLEVTDGDLVKYIGITEAFRGTSVHYRKFNHTFEQNASYFEGFNFKEVSQNESVVEESYSFVRLGLGDTEAPFSQNPYWNEPEVDNSTGAVKFHFGIEYRNFPVTWVNTLNESDIVQDPMNITYDYVYVINPQNGTATLSPTITYGGISDPALKSEMDGLGLATLYKSDFLSIQAVSAKRVTEAEDNVTSTRAAAFAVVSFSGPESNFSTIENRGAKENYTLDGTQYQTNVSVLNLVSVSGFAAAGNVTTFESDSADTVGSSYLETTEIAALNYTYRKDLILVSYPIWNGGKIVHDPTFSSVYVPAPPSSSETSTPPPTTSGPAGNETSSSETESQVTESPTPSGGEGSGAVTPGFELIPLVFMASLASYMILRRRWKLKE